MTILIVGSLLVQLPIGWLSDKTSRYILLLASTIGTLIGLILLIILEPQSNWIWTVVFCLGFSGGGIITLVMIIVGQRFTTQLLTFNASLNLISNETYIVAPTLVGLIMHIWSPNSFPIFLFLLTAIVLITLILSGSGFCKSSTINSSDES